MSGINSVPENQVKVRVAGKLNEHCPVDSSMVISKEHLHLLENKKLYWTRDGYVLASYRDLNGSRCQKAFHRFLYESITGTEIPTDRVIHHRNNLRYDNSWDNLALVTMSYNSSAIVRKETTKLKGITLRKRSNTTKWEAVICNKYLGQFESEFEAARAYDRAFVALHGTDEGSNKLLSQQDILHVLNNKKQFIPSGFKANFPSHISIKNGFFVVEIEQSGGSSITKNFKNLKQAVNFRDQVLNPDQDYTPDTETSKIILRNTEGIAVIPVKITKSKEFVHALVDDDDYTFFLQSSWHMDYRGYPRSGKFGVKPMHLLLMPPKPGYNVDHINCNKLDNRRSNLRYVTASFNARNKRKRKGCSSSYPGVCWHKCTSKWSAAITVNKRTRHLGLFDSEEAAARAYQEVYDRLEKEEEVAAAAMLAQQEKSDK